MAIQLKATAKELLLSLFSPDPKTRRMSVLFFMSLIGLMLVLGDAGTALHRYRVRRARIAHLEALEKQRLAEAADWKSALARVRQNTLSLGGFIVELSEGREADFDLSVLCSDPGVCGYVQARSVQVRNEITSALAGVRADDLLTPEARRVPHQKMLRRLNDWLRREYPRGKIEELYFTDMTVD